MWFIDIIILCMKWLINWFYSWFKKDRFTVEQIHELFDSLLTFIDTDQNNMISYHEICVMLKDLIKNLKNVGGTSNDKKESKKS